MTITNQILCSYKNGNYKVYLMKDGTKIRKSSTGEFNSVFPESIDMKITDYCNLGCIFCHENSTKRGEHSSLENIKRRLDGLPPGVEIAIGGGNPLDHPHIIDIIKWLNDMGFVVNMTVNSKHLVIDKYADIVCRVFLGTDMIKGLGISGTTPNMFMKYPNVVNHFITGEQSIRDLSELKGYNKILILGYKNYGRGIKNGSIHSERIRNNIEDIKHYLRTIYRKGNNTSSIRNFDVISFDNLAIKQLNIQSIMGGDFDSFYMGADGMFTMYYDAVTDTYATSSISHRQDFTFDNATVIDGFKSFRSNLSVFRIA